MPPWSMIMAMPFARSYNAGQLTSKEDLNLASHMAGSCSMTLEIKQQGPGRILISAKENRKEDYIVR